ncbi:MAG TPA: hypothetical protein VEG35_02880 [Burkholderiales bacterium]|nr:hypothetical protein [Burkholderiales bacterium]
MNVTDRVDRHHGHAVVCPDFGKALTVGAVVIISGRPHLTGVPEFGGLAPIALPGGAELHKFKLDVVAFKYCPFCGRDLNPPLHLVS